MRFEDLDFTQVGVANDGYALQKRTSLRYFGYGV